MGMTAAVEVALYLHRRCCRWARMVDRWSAVHPHLGRAWKFLRGNCIAGLQGAWL